MRQGRLLRFMGFTLSAKASMEIPECGSTLRMFSTTCLSEQLSMIRSSLCMAVSRQPCTRLTTLELSKEYKRFRTKVHMLIWCGAIQILINLASAFRQEELAISLEKTCVSVSCKKTAWKLFTEHTNSAKMDTKLYSMVSFLLFGVRQTTVTDTKTWPVSWSLTRT